MPETWSEWVGICGFIVAAISLGWQVWKYRNEHTEKVSGMISFTSYGKGPRVVLKLVNCGRVPVYLDEVNLCCGDSGFKDGSKRICVPFAREGPKQTPLATGSGVLYELDARHPVLSQALTLPENKIWIAVCTPLREILRLEGSKVLPVLRLACGQTK